MALRRKEKVLRERPYPIWEYNDPPFLCAICEGPLKEEKVVEERPTGKGGSTQTWSFHKECWEEHVRICGMLWDFEITGCGSEVDHLFWEQDYGGSSPLTQTLDEFSGADSPENDPYP